MGRLSLLAGLLLFSPASALEIEIRYDYDTSGFFNQPGAKEAMEAVAEFFEQRIHDSLLAIDPAQHGGSWSAGFFHPATGIYDTYEPNLVVPEDTLIVFVGARNLGGSTGVAGPGGYWYSGSSAWGNRVKYRGQTGAAPPATDFGPWGGSIAFHSSAGTTWSFQLDGRTAGDQFDFVPTALHEMCHVLGFGSSDSFNAKISGSNFTGTNAANSFGGNVPLFADSSHWDDNGCGFPGPFAADSMIYGSFARPHGDSQVALMDPATCVASFRTYLDVLTDLDLAALVDIGWQVKPPMPLDPSTIHPNAVSISWPSSTWLSYRVNRSDSLAGWTTLYGPTAGNGDGVSWQDPAPPTSKAFYQLRADFAVSPAPGAPLQATGATTGTPQPISLTPRLVTGCGQHRH